MMVALEWPDELPPMDWQALRAELDSLVEQVINEEMHALDTLDDQFARMAAALIALLDSHEPDPEGRCRSCPERRSPQQVSCDVLETIHQYLKQPLSLIWWHQFNRRGKPIPIDEIGAWIDKSQTPHSWDGAPARAATGGGHQPNC
jgi:hypothetical protein